MRRTTAVNALLAAALLACSSSSPTSGAVEVVITPAHPALRAGEVLRFVALVAGQAGAPVTWRVEEAGGGEIDSAGDYTAPAATGTFHVVATSVVHPEASGRTPVEVSDAFSIEPGAADVDILGSFRFSASLPPAYAAQGVTWRVDHQNGGSIQADGTYQAPPDPGEYPVVATSVANPARSATAMAMVRYLSISGTVTYTGGLAGRIHVASRGAGLGTTLDGPGPFTIRGFPQMAGLGLEAWLDVPGVGWFNAAVDPGVLSAVLDLSSGSLSGVTLDLAAPAPLPVWMCCALATGGDGFAIVQWPRPSQEGYEVADGYELWWGTAPAPGPGNASGSRTIPVGPNLAVVPLPPGFWRFTVVARQDATGTSASTELGVTVGPPAAAGHAVSGTLSFPALAGAPAYVVLQREDGNASHAVRLAPGPSPQPFTVAGVGDGAWRAAAFLDRGDDGLVGAGDPVLALSRRPGVEVTVAGADVEGLSLAIPVGLVLAETTVETGRYNGNVSWTVRTGIRSNEGVPAAVQVGAGVTARDLAPSPAPPQGAFPFEGSGAVRFEASSAVGLAPTVGASTSLLVTLADGQVVPAEPQVSAVLVPIVLEAPLGAVATRSPTFTWQGPAGQPLRQYLNYYPAAGGASLTILLPPGATSYALPLPLLEPSTEYWWSLTAVDPAGNSSTSADRFTTGP